MSQNRNISTHRIVVLDGYTLNPGDLSWDGLSALGQLTVHDRTPGDQILARAEGADILFVNKTPLDAATLAALPGVRYIGVLATGYNVVDIAAARDRGITVTNIPTYGTTAVAQMTFALLLELCHHVGAHSDAVRSGAWTRSPDFCFWQYPLVELADKVLGIVGYGRIGQAAGRIALAFGMEVLAFDQFPRKELEGEKMHYTSLEDLLVRSDAVSLHCPLTDENRGMICRKSLRTMKPTAMLINTARGPLVCDADLAEALNAGWIAGAAVDVLSVEPPPADNPLLTAQNCIVTPHIAWAPVASRKRLMDIAADNLRQFLEGHPVNVVNAL